MSDRAWRLNLVLMGWAALLIAAAFAAQGFLPDPAPVGRYQMVKPPFWLDSATGDVRVINRKADSGLVLSRPLVRMQYMGGLIDDIGLDSPTPAPTPPSSK